MLAVCKTNSLLRKVESYDWKEHKQDGCRDGENIHSHPESLVGFPKDGAAVEMWWSTDRGRRQLQLVEILTRGGTFVIHTFGFLHRDGSIRCYFKSIIGNLTEICKSSF